MLGSPNPELTYIPPSPLLPLGSPYPFAFPSYPPPPPPPPPPPEVTVQYSEPVYAALEEAGQVSLSLLLLGETAIPITVTASSVPLDTNSDKTAAICKDTPLCACVCV